MINIVNDNIFNSTDKIIAHQVNCMGVMGSGIALQLRNRYDGLYEDYLRFCKLPMFNTPNDLLGNCFIHINKDKLISNLFGQLNYGRDISMVYTIYNALELSLYKLMVYCISNNINSIAIPYMIGCGKANGNISKVYNIINTVFNDTGIDINIYKI